MSPPSKHTFPPVRACIFDVDGLLINSEDIYTEIYNKILLSYGKPDLPWSVKAKQQSRGLEGINQILTWSNLPLTPTQWTSQVRTHHHLFTSCVPLPGTLSLLSHLTSHNQDLSQTPTPNQKIHLAIASSATTSTFTLKTSHLPNLTAYFPPQNRVFGDDPAMSDARKKPMPDVFLLGLERVNAGIREGRGEGMGEEEVKVEECLVFEDSVAGVEAGRRAGMRVVWVPHRGLRGVYEGREGVVLDGAGEGDSGSGSGEMGGGALEGEEERLGGEDGIGGITEGLEKDVRRGLWSKDGRVQMLMSLEEFDYEVYGIDLKKD